MAVHTHQFDVETHGDTHVLNLTDEVAHAVATSPVRSGIATVFVVGSTAGITTTEFEPGLVDHDLHSVFEKIAPEHGTYEHEETWHDDNGHAHVRASLLGPSVTVPIVDGKPALGQWQQIVLIDFDTRPRSRNVIVQIMGE